MFSSNKPSKNSTDDVTEQILFCQNGIDNTHVSSENESSISKKLSAEEFNAANEALEVDILSNGYCYGNSSFELNTIQQCAVISITSPHAFTIQLSGDLIASDEFFKTMNDYYNSIDDLLITPEYLRQNLLCVTYDETISGWNRSQIMEYDLDEDTVNVFFVDLNSWEENVPRSRLRFILTKYSSRPVCSVTCRLALIGPTTNANEWDDVVVQTFQNVVLNRQCDVEPLYKRSDDLLHVNLFALHDEAYVCINDFLIHCQMAKPMDDTANERNVVSLLDDDGRPMHFMMALYWKAGETIRKTETSVKSLEDDPRSTTSDKSLETTPSSITKEVIINEKQKLIFARYNSYIMLPWFTLSAVLNELDEEKVQTVTNKFGFKSVTIDPLSHAWLYSQLSKLIPTASTSTPISLYSIDCTRKILQSFDYQQQTVFDLLDRARLAEASDDPTFWNESVEILFDSS